MLPKEESSKDLFLTCLALYQQERRGLISSHSAWVKEVRDILRNLLMLKAKALRDRNLGLECSDEFPGYLYYAYENIKVFFPWLIVDDLPSKEILNYLIKIAIQIKACSLSFTCLSGSALYFNSLRSISDIDFLEYELNPELDPPNFRSPAGFALLKRKDSYSEYVTETPFYGTVEVTNMIVGIDTTKLGLAASLKSSPYQEAPLTHTPRELYDPVALGSYISFLAGKTISYLHNQPAKAAKRLLPLSRIIEDRKIADSILNAFDSKEVQDALRVRQKIELFHKIKNRTEEPLRRFAALALNDISAIRKNKSTATKLADEESELVTSLASAVKHIAIVNYDKLKALSVA